MPNNFISQLFFSFLCCREKWRRKKWTNSCIKRWTKITIIIIWKNLFFLFLFGKITFFFKHSFLLICFMIKKKKNLFDRNKLIEVEKKYFDIYKPFLNLFLVTIDIVLWYIDFSYRKTACRRIIAFWGGLSKGFQHWRSLGVAILSGRHFSPNKFTPTLRYRFGERGGNIINLPGRQKLTMRARFQTSHALSISLSRTQCTNLVCECCWTLATQSDCITLRV